MAGHGESGHSIASWNGAFETSFFAPLPWSDNRASRNERHPDLSAKIGLAFPISNWREQGKPRFQNGDTWKHALAIEHSSRFEFAATILPAKPSYEATTRR